MSVLPPISGNEITGRLSSDGPPPSFSVPTAHPILKYIIGSSSDRQNQLLLSPHVEGIILIQNSKVVILYLPTIAFDPSTDPNETNPILLGAAGTFCSTAIPSSIDLSKVLANFLILTESTSPSTTETFPSGNVLDPRHFSNHPDKVDNALPPTSYQSTKCVAVPLVLPKIKGTKIIEGSIMNPTVLASFEGYHPAAHTWLQHHIAHATLPPTTITADSLTAIDDALLPTSPMQIKIQNNPQLHLNVLYETDQDISSLRKQVLSALQQKMALNTAKHHGVPTEDLNSHGPTNAPSLPGDILIDNHTMPDNFSIGGTSIEGKYRRPLNTWRLFLSSIGNDGTISLPVFTDAFLEGYSSSSITENTRILNSSMREHDRARSTNTRDYLHKLISDNQWNNATTALFINAILFDSQLDEFDTYLQTSISLLTFLPTPHASMSQDIQSFLQKTNVENLEAIVGESNEKKRKINLKTFQGGLQETPIQVLTGLANLESKFSFMVDYEHLPPKQQPLFVQWLNNLANVYSSRDFTKFYEKHKQTLPWIPHTMVNQVQIIFSLTARVAKSYTNQTALRKDKSLPPSIFKTVHKAYNDIIADIERAYSGASLGCFATPPPSYVPPPQAPPNQRPRLHPQTQIPLSNQRNHSSYPSHSSRPQKRRGWLQATGSYRWPKLQCGFLCNKFAQVDSQCTNDSCTLKHLVFPHSFSDSDKRTLFEFVTNHPNLSFAPHIRYAPSSSLSRPPQQSSSGPPSSGSSSPHPQENSDINSTSPST